jgi:NurA-like 5'-3' nuclease
MTDKNLYKREYVEYIYQLLSKNFFDDGSCTYCKKLIYFKKFKNNLSLKEFTISGLCQKCQDLTSK